MSTVWILTYEVNEYDQEGEYFLEVFGNKPTEEQLRGMLPNDVDVQHVLNGGGRVLYEYKWFHLRKELLQ